MTLQEIQINMTEILKEYLKDTVVPEKYFFLDKEYFFEYQKLSYNFFSLSNAEKKEINFLSQEVFKNFEFRLLMDSFKNESKLKNLNQISNKQLKTAIAEYILYYLLKEKNIKNFEIQKFNFLYAYINYLFSVSPFVIEEILKEDFELYLNSSSSKELKIRLEEDKKILRLKKQSSSFLDKYQKLYTKKTYTGKLSFYYHISGIKSRIFQDLLEIYSLPSTDTEVFFRGQATSKYDINASISRNKNLSFYENELYYEVLSLKPNYFREDKSVYENLITMQHFGLPTRLIDLSRNAMIALYFSSSDDFSKDGAVYIIAERKENILTFDDKRLLCLNELVKKTAKDKNNLKDYCRNCKIKYHVECNNSDTLKGSYIVKGLAKNERINNQSGDFIFVGAEENVKCSTTIKQNVEKILIIDRDSKTQILEELKQFNVHGGIVYPDLQNMSLHLKKEFEKRKIPRDMSKMKTIASFSFKIDFTKPNVIYNDLEFIRFYDNFEKIEPKFYKELGQIKGHFFQYICDLNEISLLSEIKKILKGYKPYEDRIKLKKIFYSILNSLKVIAYLKSVNSLRITIVEQTFDWKGYFADPNNVKVPIYNENDWAVESCELQRIESESLVVTIKEKDSFPTKYLNFNKLISYSTDYDGLILIMDYKDKTLFED